MNQKSKENNYAFVDSQNLNKGVSTDVVDRRTGKVIERGWQLDFAKFR